MATEMLEIEGIFEWAKIFEHNRDHRYSADTDGEYQLTVIMDEANAKKLKAAGCQKKMTQDPDGRGVMVRFTRPHKSANAWAGGAPKVAGPDKTEWDLETNGTIGNGSRGRVLVSVFEVGSGRKGTRMEAVQVIDHVPYITDDGDSPKQSAVNSFFKDYTGGETKAAPKAAAKADSVSEDAIPF